MADIDGRAARRRRNRDAVIEAAVSLMQEGVLDPSVEQITERSGVSPRSVFRYFESLDEMRRAVLLATVDRSRPLLAPLDEDGPLEGRVARLIDARLAMCERAAGAARAARLREPQVPTIAEDLAVLRGDVRRQVRTYFGAELGQRRPDDAEQLAALVEVLLSFEAWDHLCRVQGRDPDFIRRAWSRALAGLLGSSPAMNGNGSDPYPAGSARRA